MASSSASSSPTPKRRRVADPPPPPPATSREEDTLMSLPTEVLNIILARIPFNLLVRTSVLSRAWRRRWESVPFLDIRFDWSSPAVPTADAMWRCAAPVAVFHACALGEPKFHSHRTDSWIRAMASKGIRDLDLNFNRRTYFLDPALFSCAALVRLHLSCCEMPPAPPGFRGFPNLVSLTLLRVALPFEIDGKLLERLIEASPLLAELELEDLEGEEDYMPPNYKVNEWAVRAPRLRVLKITAPWDVGCRIPDELRLLEEAYIEISSCFPSFLDTFRQIISVKKLWFDAVERLQFDIMSTHLYRTATTQYMQIICSKPVQSLKIRLDQITMDQSLSCVCAPYIEDLSIEAEEFSWSSGDYPYEIDQDFLNSEINGNLFSGVKYVSLNGIEKSFNQMRFMKVLRALARRRSPQARLDIKLGKKPIPGVQDPRLLPEPEAAAAATREDMLMTLPPEILDNILKRVPLGELVRLSCLSRAWRRRWESVPNLRIRFDWSPPTMPPPPRALWRCAAPVASFRACVPARWFRALARRGDPRIPRHYCLLGPALFSCAATLVGLHLQNCQMPPAPQGFEGFPSLLSLTLCHVRLSRSTTAPRLAELKLHDVEAEVPESVDGWAIWAPNLRVLKMVITEIDSGCWIPEDLLMLEEAYIIIDSLLPWTEEFLRRITTVRKLWFDTRKFYENPFEGISWKFQNLREVHLTTCFGKLPSVMSILSLLGCSPCIENLTIEDPSCSLIHEPYEIDEDFLNSEISDNLFSSLKHVSLSGINYFTSEMRFVKFLLSRIESLQTFVVAFINDESNEWYVNVRTELDAFGRASRQARLEVKHRDEPTQGVDDSSCLPPEIT
uniref:F-box domain-containing protein n=1 Tax=Leersia perrieri TaxID=77586 RepID=A0A0D9X630_9ORYZ